MQSWITKVVRWWKKVTVAGLLGSAEESINAFGPLCCSISCVESNSQSLLLGQNLLVERGQQYHRQNPALCCPAASYPPAVFVYRFLLGQGTSLKG